MIIHKMEQGTPEWFAVKKGKLSASKGTAIRVNGAGLKTLVTELVIGMFAPEENGFTGKDVERGNELEPIARMKYEFEKNVTVDEVGFIEVSEHFGISPDGLVGSDGLVEIKARNNKKHLELLLGGKIEQSALDQMQTQMFGANRKWCDFVSYNPNFKKNSIFIKRVHRDETEIQKIRKGVYNGTNMIKELLKNPKIQEEIQIANNLEVK